MTTNYSHIELQNAGVIAQLTGLVDRLYTNLSKVQGDLKSITSQYRGRGLEITQREEQIDALRRQLDEMELLIQYPSIEAAELEVAVDRSPL